MLMNLSRRAAAVTIGGLVLAAGVAIAPVALAADNTACTDARALVIGAQTRLDVQLSSDEVNHLADQHKQLDLLNVQVAAAEKVVADAVAADNAHVPPLTVDSAATVTAKASLTALKAQVTDLTGVIAKVEDLTVKLRADIGAALGVRDRTCRPTATLTPTPTAAPAPAPSTSAPRTSHPFPIGGIDTGA